MGWKKLFVGEKMPDKNDPKYKSMPVASSHV